MKKLISACVLTAAAALIGGCQTASEAPQSTSAIQPTQPAAGSGGQEPVYVNNFFKATVPAGWRVVSSDGPGMPARLTLQSNDYQAYITIRVTRSDLGVDELCRLAAKGFTANGAEIVQGPEVRFGTCTIRAETSTHPSVLWLRTYEGGSVYAVNFTGEQEKVNEVLSRLEGNDRLMQLFVMPL